MTTKSCCLLSSSECIPTAHVSCAVIRLHPFLLSLILSPLPLETFCSPTSWISLFIFFYSPTSSTYSL